MKSLKNKNKTRESEEAQNSKYSFEEIFHLKYRESFEEEGEEREKCRIVKKF